ncbi:pimeloyl-ACP methyl ester carboxylesterase [Rhodoglobus vestalii]|uniref:Pimeloyl-ACP methyl ester carboxylesterase n=1 Tax=Rhodoglobus vestalii TaxID=193384 RepID=A0A8H2PW33_9MICO|nr:alpha/beta hydrolase [Rhodoglobus vestalii]TQO18790.1 pimeloyl-ACP methyl ester carboxylesterase [Rhodoglobus vestalii]
MASISTTSAFVTTNDGNKLHYREAGNGPVLVLVPGWSQTAAQFQKQIDRFSADHRVIALDSRGHGESSKPAYGYRISRLAADLHDLLVGLDLHDVTLLGHSMGCSVIWSYWDLYAGERVARLILVDQPAVLVTSPFWEEGVGADLSAIFAPAQTYEIAAGLSGSTGAEVSAGLLSTMWTDKMTEDDKAWIIERNLELPRALSAQLLIDHAFADWRDVLPRITVPTLVIGGTVSLFPAAGIEWVASQIPGAQLRIFSGDELGSHFAFWENSDLFNDVVAEFLSSAASV